jgi:mannosyltransferase
LNPHFSKPIFWFTLASGIFLRFHALDRQSLWDDEMSTIHTISTPAGGLLHRFATYETHPPLYFLQLRVWWGLDLRSLVKLRANSAFWGSLSLFLAYLIGRRYGGEEVGLLTMA